MVLWRDLGWRFAVFGSKGFLEYFLGFCFVLCGEIVRKTILSSNPIQ